VSVSKKIIGKVILAGDGAVGKTTLLNKFLGKTEEEVKITVGLNIQSASYEIEGEREIKSILVFWDFAGQPQFRFFQQDFAKNPFLVIFVFDLTRYKTLINIEKEWLPMFKNDGKDAINKVLVGNKCDLGKTIQEDEIRRICGKYHMKYFEVSAKTNKNVNELYKFIKKQIFERVKGT